MPEITPSSLCVFCGARFGTDPATRETAVGLGRLLAAEGITLVYGGGGVGLMGLVANAALDAGGRAVGIIPNFLLQREAGHPALTETVVALRVGAADEEAQHRAIAIVFPTPAPG